MINLKKLFRRKKGQGALEYLFMIAAALIIIFVVVRYISGSTQQASQQGDIASLQSQAELARTTLQSKNLWSNEYYVYYNTTDEDNIKLEIYNTTASSGTVIGEDTNLDYETEYDNEINWGTDGVSLKTLYDNCMNSNDKPSCYVLADLQDVKKK